MSLEYDPLPHRGAGQHSPRVNGVRGVEVGSAATRLSALLTQDGKAGDRSPRLATSWTGGSPRMHVQTNLPMGMLRSSPRPPNAEQIRVPQTANVTDGSNHWKGPTVFEAQGIKDLQARPPAMTYHAITNTHMEALAFDKVYSDRFAHADTASALGTQSLIPTFDPRTCSFRPANLTYGEAHVVQTCVGMRNVLPSRSFILPYPTGSLLLRDNHNACRHLDF